MSRHYKLQIRVEDARKIISREHVERVASKYFNNDSEPKITLNRGKIESISLRVDFNNPVKVFNSGNLCEAIYVIVKFLEELGIVWRAIEIYETVTYEVGGVMAGSGAAGGLSAAAKMNGIVTAIFAVIGGIGGYFAGRRAEKVVRMLCKYENRYWLPVIV